MAFPLIVATLLATALVSPKAQATSPSARVPLPGFDIDATEVSVAAFADFVDATRLITSAERAGGGYEWGAGWEKRPGWTWRAPYGVAARPAEPAVHVSWQEASAYCEWRRGRLPARDEWALAAYHETRSAPPDGFEHDRLYPYPTGSRPVGANTRAPDEWPRHALVGGTSAGVNGLWDMGGNVWEWLQDRDGPSALTAGGSWWYGSEQMRIEAMQWKPADFQAVYIGFRCVYPG